MWYHGRMKSLTLDIRVIFDRYDHGQSAYRISQTCNFFHNFVLFFIFVYLFYVSVLMHLFWCVCGDEGEVKIGLIGLLLGLLFSYF